MKLLLFSDLHSDEAAARSLANRASEFDVLVGAGDFCNARHGLEQALTPFLALDTPMVLVAGNNESPDELRHVCRNTPRIHVLHGESCHIGNQLFFGIGGGIPKTPFGSWSFDLDENKAVCLLDHCPTNAILISHSPPMGTLDVSSSGKSLGSRAVAECMTRKIPKLLVCGHIHASAGHSKLVGQTLVVNAGPKGISWQC